MSSPHRYNGVELLLHYRFHQCKQNKQIDRTETHCKHRCINSYHDEGEDCEATTPDSSVVDKQGCAVVANQLDPSIDVTVEPVDLHTGISAHQQTHKG